MKPRHTLGFAAGFSFFLFVWWLSGNEIPMQRGGNAVFVLFESIGCGVIGAIIAQCVAVLRP